MLRSDLLCVVYTYNTHSTVNKLEKLFSPDLSTFVYRHSCWLINHFISSLYNIYTSFYLHQWICCK